MKSKSISHCAEALAREISERRIIDVSGIKTLIEVRFYDALEEFLKEHTDRAETEYFKLLEEQSKTKLNSHQYIQNGYKLSLAKHKKTTANRVRNEIKTENLFKMLQSFVINRYGKGIIEEFISTIAEEELKQSLSKQKILQ